MGSFGEDEESQFFDARDDIASISDAYSDNSQLSDSNCNSENWVADGFDVWTRSPASIKERRRKFLNFWFSDRISGEIVEDACQPDPPEGEVAKLCVRSGNSLRTSCFEDAVCTTRSSMFYGSHDDQNWTENMNAEENSVGGDDNLDGLTDSNCSMVGVDRGMNHDGKGGLMMTVKFEKSFQTSSLTQRQLQGANDGMDNSVATMKKLKGFLSRLRSFSCTVDAQVEATDPRLQTVKVHRYGKRLKELSALYMKQDIKAHKGSILVMKFSPDGQFLASAGEDGIVRVWKVVVEERFVELDISNIDPSCTYFKVNQLSKLTPLFLAKEKMSKAKNLRKASDTIFVIFPTKVFRVVEKPLHEFHGHDSEILDLSWSNNNFLLSSSVDQTVRLWRVGCDHCLKVFLHSNYVTCVQFNPADENYFISGSIDGKVRIWSISNCHVVDWTDIKEIITAVCYKPDGQAGIVGTMAGNCFFYDLSENHLQLNGQISLVNKKKSPSKRITGVEFSPQDSSKVMVTCADSRVRILQGFNVIRKYEGLHIAGNHSSASFTSDGKHIISTCEDSNVYLWNCTGQKESSFSKAKKITSCERFSADASVAIPWCGFKCRNSENGNSGNGSNCCVLNDNSMEALPSSSPTCFFLDQEFLMESESKGSATWPEEKLPKTGKTSTPFAMNKSQYKVLRASCQSSSHAWGLVIVTAGWDGRIRSYHNFGLPVTT